MNAIFTRLFGAAALIGLSLAAAPAANAALVSLAPSTTGGTTDLSVSTNGLGNNLLGGFDIEIGYNPSALTIDPTDLTTNGAFGSKLGVLDNFDGIGSVSLLSPGLLEISEVSFLTADQLAALQAGGDFQLFDLDFSALGGDADFNLLSATLVDASGSPIPEAPTWAFLVGLPMLAWFRRRSAV